MFELTDVNLNIGSNQLLSHVNLSIKDNDRICLIGKNGTGKSTFLRAIAGIIPLEGRIYRKRGLTTNLIGHGSSLFDHLNGFENINAHYIIRGYPAPSTEIKKRILDISGLTIETLQQKSFMYSTGTKARLSFAISHSLIPDLLLIDEVLSVGDESFRSTAQSLLNQKFASPNKVATVVVTHELDFCESYCNQVWVIENGELHQFKEVVEGLSFYRSLFS